MDDTTIREILIRKLSDDAGRFRRDRSDLMSKLYIINMNQNYTARLIKQLELTDAEMDMEFRMLLEDVGPVSDDEISDLAIRSRDYINTAYDEGKHDGREVKCLFRRLFELIGDEALVKFEDKV